jgi:hypothetical protein
MRCYSPARSLGTLHDTTTCCDFTSGGQSLRDEYKFILMRLAPNCEVFVSAADQRERVVWLVGVGTQFENKIADPCSCKVSSK